MTWFRCGGGGSGIPAALKNRMNAVLNKKFGTAVDYPAEGWPDDVNLLGELEEKTASGSIVTFSDGADEVPLKSCEVALSASLDGYSSVDVVRSMKNFLDDTLSNLEQGSINGSTGINENANNRVRTINAIPFPYDKIASSYTWTIPSGYKVAIRPFDKDGNFVQLPSWALAFITQLPTDLIGQGITQMKFVLAKTDNSAITPSDIANIGFQIEVGSTATAYEPYTAPTQYTAQLGRTIYGGTVDVVTGQGTGKETHDRIKFSDLNWTYYTGGTNPIFYAINIPNMKICERGEMPSIVIDGYVTRTAHSRSYLSANMADMECSAIENAQTITFRNDTYTSVSDMLAVLGDEYIVYELATTTDFTFTGQEINTRLGYNAFWSDEGDTEVVYRASGTVTPITPTLITKTITANGSYRAADDSADGYSEIVVNVPQQTPTIDPIMSLNAFVTKSGVSGTNTSTVARSFTMSAAGTLVFASGTYGFTDAGSNEGYFEIQKNGVSVVKQYCNTNTNTPIAIPEISVEENDVIDLVIGFDNAHSNCRFQFYSAMVVLSEV